MGKARGPTVRRPMSGAVVERDGKVLVLACPYEHRRLARSLGARWDYGRGARGAWTLPATPAAASGLVRAFRTAGVEVTFGASAADLEASASTLLGARGLSDAAGTMAPPPSRTAAWPHQVRAWYFALNLDAAMLAMDMGTGKSKVAIDL